LVSELANRWPARNPLSCDVTLRKDVELRGGGTRCADDVAFTLTRLTTGGAIHSRPRHGMNRRKNVSVNKIIFDVIFPDRASYQNVCRSRARPRETAALPCRIPDSRNYDLVQFDPVDASLFGARQCAALLDRKVDNR
jgi:hypothetical protein